MAKHLAQIIITGAQVIGRAFAKALRQEIAASQAAAARAGGGAKGAEHSATNQRLGLTIEEAKQILNVEDLDKENIQQKFEYLYNINDKTKGGTLYLQSKMKETRLRLSSGISRHICQRAFHFDPFLATERLSSGISRHICHRAYHFNPLLLTRSGTITEAGSRYSFSTQVGGTWNAILSEKNRIRCVEKMKRLPTFRRTPELSDNYSAVLVPMCLVEGELCLLYTLRTTGLRSHRREVSFPGGKKDSGDNSFIETALRETEEEIGIRRDLVDVWGSMPPQQGKDGLSSIISVLGYIGEVNESSFCLSPGEVESVLVVSLKNLCLPSNCRQTQFRSTLYKSGFTLPSFIGCDPKIWGLTAIITHQTLSALVPGLYKHSLYHVTY